MAKRKKIYLEVFKHELDLCHEYKVKRVIGTLRHLPGDMLTHADVALLVRMESQFEVIIDQVPSQRCDTGPK